MTDAVTFTDLRVQYGASTVIDDLDLSIRQGDFTCFLGPSGCGKSTMLRIVGELLEPAGGEVTVLGEPTSTAWSQLAYVFQAPRLVPWRSAIGNIELGLQLRGIRLNRKQRRLRAMESMETIGIAHLADRPAHQLSGGEQQRVAIARALAVRPKVLLMDEPFSALDVQTRRQLRQEIVSVWKNTGLTIIFVTHDVDEAIIVGNRVVVFSPKPTVLLADKSVDLPKPIDVSSAGFTRLHEEIVHLFGSTEAIDELTGRTT
ncbi:ABC transporter ATP-binding protein [Microbacterium sp. ARD31]|uniref:ABC transporter ATP-binding protein n=1 Tax=Microbacterium sp. ARD31 TaxID=2962576 RepID=UPI0028822862|nr:ABC transporter ATP-binding protein [Microbacterium sp. ARD31]MDT0183949.1 ABC transporter ATP-binding protein [Microbacterium sp. ARD31]